MKYLLLISFLFTHSAFASSQNYVMLKGKIDALENSVIRDFDIEIPQAHADPEIFGAALRTVENQYEEQVANFIQVEKDLAHLKKRLESSAEELESGEAERLINSIEYANRIILRSRKDEVNKIYHKLKSKLSHIPKLEQIHNQLQTASKQDECFIKNLLFDKLRGILSFEVFTKESKTINFHLTQGDVSGGHVNSEKKMPSDLLVTQYQSPFVGAQGVHSFTLERDPAGQIVKASFHQQDLNRPWLEVMGLEFGTETENRIYVCGKK